MNLTGESGYMQTTLMNFNGVSEWQNFNGLQINSNLGLVDQQVGDKQKTDPCFRDSTNVSHKDSILDMEMIEL